MDYVGTWFQGTRIRGHLDIPLPVRKRWQKIAMAVSAINDLKNKINVTEAMPGFNDDHAKRNHERLVHCYQQIEDIQLESNLVVTLDKQFSKWWESYAERKNYAMSDTTMWDMGNGVRECAYDWLLNELREKLHEAIQRITGTHSG